MCKHSLMFYGSAIAVQDIIDEIGVYRKYFWERPSRTCAYCGQSQEKFTNRWLNVDIYGKPTRNNQGRLLEEPKP